MSKFLFIYFYHTVSGTGTVAVVHNPTLIDQRIVDFRVNAFNTNFFKVSWDGAFPSALNSCGNGECQSVNGDCLCSITVEESTVFTSVPTAANAISQLHVGGPDINRFDGTYTLLQNLGGVKVYQKNGGGYDKHTVFAVEYHGEETFLRNVRSTVKITGANYSFRNPPQFLTPTIHNARDAVYETDEVLKHYFHHENVAPFLATRIIQRMGISNPSTRYIETVATAFAEGTYSNGGQTFGAGKYGDLGAMVSAIILDREARAVLLDADPTSESLREPIIKLMGFLRSMEFEKHNKAPELRFTRSLQIRIGQAPHWAPNVFSYFLPEYATPCHIVAASLTSPEVFNRFVDT